MKLAELVPFSFTLKHSAFTVTSPERAQRNMFLWHSQFICISLSTFLMLDSQFTDSLEVLHLLWCNLSIHKYKHFFKPKKGGFFSFSFPFFSLSVKSYSHSECILNCSQKKICNSSLLLTVQYSAHNMLFILLIFNGRPVKKNWSLN